MGHEHPEDSGDRDGTVEAIETVGRKWRVLRLVGKVCLIIGTALFVVLFSLHPTHATLLFDVSTWLLFAGFVLYAVGRLGSW